MSKKDKRLMFGPLMPLNLGKATNEATTDMNAMTDLVRALKDVEVSPEKIDQNRHTGVGSATGESIKLSEDESHTEEE